MTSPEQRAEVEAVKVEQVDRNLLEALEQCAFATMGRIFLSDDALELIAAFRLAAQSARHPADQDEVEAVEEGVRDYFVNHTGFVTVDGDNRVSASYGGNWIALSPSAIATAAIERLRPFREAAEAKAREEAAKVAAKVAERFYAARPGSFQMTAACTDIATAIRALPAPPALDQGDAK
jgi:hypothetical protein